MKVGFLWHMHQPYYKDLISNRFIMPWTFLHLIKDYFDMIKIVEEFENVKVTFNFVPSLLEQIEVYSESLDEDNFIMNLKKPVVNLNENDKKSLFKQLFLANYENMIFPLKRFRELYEKKENYKGDFTLFTNQEFLDLEVLYLLSWCGYYIKKESSTVKKLIDKGKNFSEEDKLELLQELHKFIKKVIPEYREMLKNNRIEISTSPYYHPILPLLIDINIAKVALPDIQLPYLTNSFKEDAREQLTLAKIKFKEVFEVDPVGMWPSEGSVSDEAVNLIKDFNFQWVATDEDILFLSKKGVDRRFLYRGFDFNGIKVFFRDKDLSNLIGFIYSKWNYEDAAVDFYNRIKNIQKMVNDEPDKIVSIILDGENAWEFYKDNGVPFLRRIYELIENDETLEFVTFSEFIAKSNSFEKLEGIYPGSWINANFRVWIGHHEDNKAWELLDTAKGFLEKKKNDVEKDKFSLAYKELLIAEGSDWFWWYGDEFYSEISDEFDALYRTHLSNIYTIFNEDIPIEFLMPIKLQKKSILITKPVDIVSPIIDGKITNYFEWTSAGEFNFSQDSSTMHFHRGYFHKMMYGFDEENLYLRFDFGINLKEQENLIFELSIYNQDHFKLTYDFENDKLSILKKENGDFKQIERRIEFAYDKILEIKLPLKEFNINNGEIINLYASIFVNGKLMEKAPFDSTIKIEVPENIYLDYWKV